ncbi:unnamed protein product, partial [Urochloa humidicola]
HHGSLLRVLQIHGAAALLNFSISARPSERVDPSFSSSDLSGDLPFLLCLCLSSPVRSTFDSRSRAVSPLSLPFSLPDPATRARLRGGDGRAPCGGGHQEAAGRSGAVRGGATGGAKEVVPPCTLGSVSSCAQGLRLRRRRQPVTHVVGPACCSSRTPLTV